MSHPQRQPSMQTAKECSSSILTILEGFWEEIEEDHASIRAHLGALLQCQSADAFDSVLEKKLRKCRIFWRRSQVKLRYLDSPKKARKVQKVGDAIRANIKTLQVHIPLILGEEALFEAFKKYFRNRVLALAGNEAGVDPHAETDNLMDVYVRESLIQEPPQSRQSHHRPERRTTSERSPKLPYVRERARKKRRRTSPKQR